MRSLYRRLHQRFGRRISGRERVRRAAAHRARIARFLPLNLMTHAIPPRAGDRVRVAVVGGGFAGLAAAKALQNLQAVVTVFEARSRLGGRVQTNSTFIPGRMLETGAELIGASHPLWLQLAREFGFGLNVITEDDHYGEAGLALPVRLLGRRLTPAQVERLHGDMKRAADDLSRRAAVITDPFNPWNAADAGRLDSTSLQSWIHGFTSDPLLRAALELEYANDNCVRTADQSLLAVLTQIAGGGGDDFWEDVEVFRCSDGNVALAHALAARITTDRPAGAVHLPEVVSDVDIVSGGREVLVTSSRPGVGRRTTRHDFAVLALPPSVWPALTLGGRPIPIPRIQMGPAVKYLAETRKRFWVKHGDSPSGVSDDLGQTWEGTDNQMGGGSIALTMFAGGPFADAIRVRPPDPFVDPRIDALLPGYRGGDGKARAIFADWPAEPFIRTGYCIPRQGQVTTLMLRMQQAIGQRIFFAGEHVSPPFFGFMEGALQTGLAAAARIGAAMGVTLPAAIGTLTGSGVRTVIPSGAPLPSPPPVPVPVLTRVP
jgi:monoamine oxidase